jgi:hypothetical protein
MNSTANPKVIEPNNVFISRADEQLARAYQQIASADEQLAHLTQQLSKLEHDAARHPSAARGRGPSRGSPARRGLTGLLVAACVFAAAFVSQSSYGDAARLTIARWAPQLHSTALLQLENPALYAQSSPSAVQVAKTESEALPSTASTETARQDVAPTAAPISPDLAQLLQTMARDLATVELKIEQLKTSQDQLAADNAKTVEQLKVNQEQMTRLVARASEPNLRPKASAPPPRPTAAPARNSVLTPPR